MFLILLDIFLIYSNALLWRAAELANTFAIHPSAILRRSAKPAVIFFQTR
jgi:hypothetical protein